jgi:glycosyltransferase involved in cell wall biosynthesis
MFMQNVMPSADRVQLHIGLVGPLPPPFGGMANQTRQLYFLLRSEGIAVTLIQTNTDYQVKWAANIKGLRAIFRLFPYLIALWKQTGKVDCLHVMANSGWSWQLYAAPAVWIGCLRKVPVVVNYRGGDAERYFRASIKWVAPTLRNASAIIVPSGFLEQVFSIFGFRAEIIPNIVDLNKFAFKHRVSLADINSPRLVITRNLEKIYGIETAIEAVAILKQRFPKIKVFIAGSGPLHDVLLKQVEELCLAENVEFTGKLTPEQIAGLYHDVDIMLNPTTVDNMPNSVLEALANGLPVVTTNVGGIPYIVSDNETALLVDMNNPVMMAAKVEQLIDNPGLYEKLVLNGIAQVESYNWENVKHQWLGLYSRVME